MLNSRCVKIIKYITKNDGSTTIKDISKELSIGERSIRYDIQKIEDFLEENNLDLLKRGYGGVIELIDTHLIEDLLVDEESNYEHSIEDRTKLIIFSLLFKDTTKIQDMASKLEVSRTTIKNDLEVARGYFNKKNIEIIAGREGIYISVDEVSIRKMQLEFLLNNSESTMFSKNYEASLLSREIGSAFNCISTKDINKFINYTVKLLGKIVSDDAFKTIHYYLLIMIRRLRLGNAIGKIANSNFLSDTKEYKILSRSILHLEINYDISIPNEEILAVTDYFLGSHTYNFSHSFYENWVEIELLIKKVIKNVHQVIDIDILKDKILFDGLVNHIKPTIYRVRKGISLNNAIVPEVMEVYSELFTIVKGSINDIERFIGVDFSDEEIAYLTIHFKSAMDRNLKVTRKNVLLVCGQGLGSSRMLAEQLQRIYSIDIVDIIPENQLSNFLEKKIDYVISTLPLSGVEAIVVDTILKEKDLKILDKFLSRNEDRKFLLSEVIDLVRRSSKVLDEGRLVEDLISLFKGILINDTKKGPIRINSLLSSDSIALRRDAKDWKEAIEISGRLLVDENFVEEKYIYDMIETIENYGAYIVIADGLAIPHARNCKLVYKSCMSLVTLEKPVEFPGGKVVDTLFTFASKDNKEHLDSLVDLMELINEHSIRENLRGCKSSFEVIRKIEKLLKI